MKKVAQVWAFLPIKAKIAVVAAAVVAAYLVYRKISKKNDADLAAEQLKSSVYTMPVNKSNLTLTDNELVVMASQLYTAMEGAGTDTGTIDTVFSKVKTKDDLSALIRAYGVRDGEDLRMWLKSDLSGARLKSIKQVFEDLGLVF